MTVDPNLQALIPSSVAARRPGSGCPAQRAARAQLHHETGEHLPAEAFIRPPVPVADGPAPAGPSTS
jgi:hypothetical protein